MTDTIESRGTRLPRPGRRTTWVVAAALVVGLLVALPFAWHWWTHPDLFPDHTRTSSVLDPQPVDEATTAYALWPPRSRRDPVTLTWHGATAVFAKNTARATVTYELCDTVRRLGRWESSQLQFPLTYVCSAQRPLTDGTRVTYPDPYQLVLLILTPTRPGVVHLTGVDVRYTLGLRQLFRHGTDHLALNAHLTAR
jgi:hypothetical protein